MPASGSIHNVMTGYGFFRALRGISFLALLALAGFGISVAAFVGEASREISFRKQYGAEWQAQYEKDIGPLSKAHERLAAAGLGMVAIPGLTFWIIKLLTAKSYNTGGRKKSPARRISNTERVMRARSRAVLFSYLGALGIAVGMLLVVVRWGIFADHADESTLGIIIFGAGYCSVMAGCWRWLQAKHWSEALIVIGLWPLPIAFIPFVRIIFAQILLSSPVLLLLLMLLTPAVLLVVVATLPDKSGVNRKQRRPMNWKNIGERGRQ